MCGGTWERGCWRGFALGAGAQSVLVLVTFKLSLIPEVTSAVGKIQC